MLLRASVTSAEAAEIGRFNHRKWPLGDSNPDALRHKILKSVLAAADERRACIEEVLILLVVNLDVSQNDNGSAADEDQRPEWYNVYAGLSDDRIATLERAISRRLDITRPAK